MRKLHNHSAARSKNGRWEANARDVFGPVYFSLFVFQASFSRENSKTNNFDEKGG